MKAPGIAALVAISVAGYIGGYFYFSPPLAEQCLAEWSDDLVDPRSAYVVDSFTKEEAGTNLLTVQISAKNGLGGSVASIIKCPLTDGKIDEMAMLSYRIDQIVEVVGD